ncbi:MAG: Tad domain-containing protein [Gemmatimonadota bacterium]
MPGQPHRQSRPGRLRRERRGATLVFVALLTIVLVGMTAFAVDISRMYVGTNELQTGADAAALRGALRLQRVPGVSPAPQVVAFAGSNDALGAALAVSEDQVQPMFWDPATATASTATWATANAVEVTAQRTAGLLFGRVLTAVAPTPQRKAIAWIANLGASTCIKPWTMPMSGVLEMLGVAPTPERALTQAEIETLRNKPIAERTVLLGAPLQTGKATYSEEPSAGRWAAIKNYDGSGKPGYVDAVGDNDCSNSSTSLGPVETDAPNASLDGWTTDGVSTFCYFASGQDNCYDSASFTNQGVKVMVAFASQATEPGNENLVIYMLGEFVLQCYKQKAASNTCSSSFVSPTEWSKYDEGALLGYINPSLPELGNGMALGNTLSTSQRLILVR